MPVNMSLHLDLVEQSPPRPPPPGWIPSTDIAVAIRVAISGVDLSPAWRWAGRIDLYGADPAGPHLLFPMQWVVWVPGPDPRRPRLAITETFYVGAGTTVLTRSMSVASQRLDEDPADSSW